MTPEEMYRAEKEKARARNCRGFLVSRSQVKSIGALACPSCGSTQVSYRLRHPNKRTRGKQFQTAMYRCASCGRDWRTTSSNPKDKGEVRG